MLRINSSLKSEVVEDFGKNVQFFLNNPLRGNFTILFGKDSPPHRFTTCVQISWNLGNRKSAKSCVTDLTKKTKNSPHSRFCVDHAQNLPRPVADNVLRLPQISSKSVHFQRSYSRTCEHHWNIPWSISNIRLKPSFEPNKKLKPGFVAFYDIQPGNRDGLLWFWHFINLSLTYLLRHLPTYSPRPTLGSVS